MSTEDLLSRVVLAIDDDQQRSINAFNWLRDDPLGMLDVEVQLDVVHVVKEDKEKARGLEVLKSYELWSKTTFPEKFVDKTKLLQSKEGAGPALRDFTKEINPKLLVLAASNSNTLKHRLVGGVVEYCERFCVCPVVVIKKDRRMDIKKEKVVQIAVCVAPTGPSDNAVNWFLTSANLSTSSTLVIVHAVTRPTEKPKARKFLASYQSRCVASKKEYTMKSGLVYFKGKNIPDSIVKYCRDYHVDLLILAPNSHEGIKLTGSLTDSIARSIECDFLIWKAPKRPNLEIKTRDLTPRVHHRRSSLDAHFPRAQVPKGKMRRFSMGADTSETDDVHGDDGKPEEVSYVFGAGGFRTMSP